MLHGYAHGHLKVGLSAWQRVFVTVVIVAAPLAALAFLGKNRRTLGGILLFLSMLGALLFGVTYHFLISGSDNVLSMPRHGASLGFVTTAGMLAVLEALGCVWGLRTVKRALREDSATAGHMGRSNER